MSLGETKTPVVPSGEGPGKPVRKPIPLPPESLRPPPRRRMAAAPVPSPVPGSARGEEPAHRGVRRGFLLGLCIPLILAAFAGGWWWSTRTPETGNEGFEVRARIDPPVAAPVEETAAPVHSPEPASPAPVDPLSIQVASFRTATKARRILGEVEAATGLRGTILETRVDGVRWHRILLGAFGSTQEAREAGAPLLRSRLVSEILVVPVPEAARGALLGEEEGP